MAATHPRWPLKCDFNTYFGGVLFISGMVMYRDEYFVYQDDSMRLVVRADNMCSVNVFSWDVMQKISILLQYTLYVIVKLSYILVYR